ncbi:hypothetical protein COO92_21285 [Thalassospira lohafexi]|uniref:Uncharacterized protein n=2 Tax=Thalassospira lohafexi TaxID=744227 RepID=A0A2N3L0L3_9PROT|nr:hypothetical protein COO92_21285 [Thalassospira lohafexi]
MAELSIEQKKALAIARARKALMDKEAANADPLAGITPPEADVWRAMNMGAKGFADSAMETVGALPDFVASGMRSAGLDVPEGNYHTDALKKGWQAFSEAIGGPVAEVVGDAGPDAIESTSDKVAYGAGRGAADAASIMVPAAAVAKTAKPGSMLGETAKVLAGQQGVQLGAGAVGGAVGEATNNPYIGTAAAMAAGVAAGMPGAIRSSRQASQAIKNAPTTKQLAQQGSKLFERAKGSSAVIKPDSYADFLAKTEKRLLGAGADPQVHPKLGSVMNALTKRIGNEMDIQDLQNARRVAANAAASRESDERRLGKMLVSDIDDYIRGLSANDLVAGKMGTAADDLAQARGVWSRMKKSEIIEEAMSKAEKQASGFENGLRVQFRSILNNPNKVRGFAEDEIKAMQAVVEGAPVRNAMRLLGKFGIDVNKNTNAIGALSGAIAGSLVDPIGTVAVPLASSVARKGAEVGTSRTADLARALVASGPNTLPKASNPRLEQLASILMAREKDRLMSPQMAPAP